MIIGGKNHDTLRAEMRISKREEKGFFAALASWRDVKYRERTKW